MIKFHKGQGKEKQNISLDKADYDSLVIAMSMVFGGVGGWKIFQGCMNVL